MTEPTGPRPDAIDWSPVDRPSARIGILSPGTSEFDSRAHRIARTLAARGDTVTVYSPATATRPRIARGARRIPGGAHPAVPLGHHGEPGSAVRAGADLRGGARRSLPGRIRAGVVRVLRRAHTVWLRVSDRVPAIHRFRIFPQRPLEWAGWFERGVEPHDLWHGMWAPSLPALERVRRRHGGVTLYDPRDVYLRSRIFAPMGAWQRRILTRLESRWAHRADAVIQVSEPYAEMTARDLGLGTLPVVRNTPDRWDPPVPRPDRFRRPWAFPRPPAWSCTRDSW
ncbi:MAG: hypothetical protein KF809_07285 [Chloroflexi bacterium]|nr:hypothetical protein [Chloroflexota bacterium]